MEITVSLIKRYIEQFQQHFGWDLLIYDHYRILAQDEDLTRLLPEYNWHLNPYCLRIKDDARLQRRCAQLKNRFHASLRDEDTVTCVTCYCGVTELIIPIVLGGKAVCLLAATGYAGPLSPQMKSILCRRTGLSPAELDALRAEHLPTLEPERRAALETFLQVLAALLRSYLIEHPQLLHPGRPVASDSIQQRYVYDALDYIRSNYTRDIGIREVAAHCHVSPSYLQHLFSTYRGCGISTELRLCRLAGAAELLCTTEHSVRAIALRSGFHAVDYFSTLFGHQYGMTPLAYRRKYGRHADAT